VNSAFEMQWERLIVPDNVGRNGEHLRESAAFDKFALKLEAIALRDPPILTDA
jgi:hypothetical protein